MNNVKVELNSSGIRELLQSPEVENICLEQVKKMQSACGSKTTVDTYVGRTRVNAMIKGPKKEIQNALEAIRK